MARRLEMALPAPSTTSCMRPIRRQRLPEPHQERMMDNPKKPGNMVNLGDLPVAESLIEYPSDFPIKIMGAMQDSFAEVIVEVVTRHDPEFHAGRLEMRPSSKG